MNIVTGQSAHPDVNADNAVSLGHRAMENVNGGWLDSLYCPPCKLVVTADLKKNHIISWLERVHEQKFIYGRVIVTYLQAHEISTSMMCWHVS